MSKYLLAIFDGYVGIRSISARSLEDAENRFMRQISTEYDLDVPTDWESFCEDASNHEIYIGEVTSIEEFE